METGGTELEGTVHKLAMKCAVSPSGTTGTLCRTVSV